MNIYKHPDNGWHWFTHRDLRVDWLTWRALLNHLKSKFQRRLLQYESQDVYTYNTDEATLKNAVDEFLNLR